MRENGDVLDWFEIESPEGFCSIRDKIGVFLHSEEAAPVVRDCLRQHFVVKPMDSDEEILKEFAQMLLRRVLGLGWAKKTTRNEMLEMNRWLNCCRR